jgi:hypothetical protein
MHSGLNSEQKVQNFPKISKNSKILLDYWAEIQATVEWLRDLVHTDFADFR